VRQFDARAAAGAGLADDVVSRILDEESTAVAELEEFIGKTIRFQPEEQYSQEQYDVVVM
jgi:ribonuclease G